MPLGAGTVFFLLLAFGLYRFFPRLAATLVLLAFLGVVGLFGSVIIYASIQDYRTRHPQRVVRVAAAPQPRVPTEADIEALTMEIIPATPAEAAAAVARLRA